MKVTLLSLFTPKAGVNRDLTFLQTYENLNTWQKKKLVVRVTQPHGHLIIKQPNSNLKNKTYELKKQLKLSLITPFYGTDAWLTVCRK